MSSYRNSSSSLLSSSKSNSNFGRKCLCSPTNHPGSFRCSLHRGSFSSSAYSGKFVRKSMAQQLNRLDGAKKTKMVKEFLMQIIKPSSHHLQRRRNFQPKPTRFFVLNHDHTHVAGNQLAVS